ncbi:RING finger protein 37 [Periplaneta americana]|uniref:RING finger protein 37 n=1 Tax=Periplaneta americana TaxID=6978 RepID=UPI0037E79DB3
MMNFCSSVLKPTISCSTVCNDGYEVTNLISGSVVERNKGFLAYNAIKPPITITINFPCSINIAFINLWAQIGYQKSTGFEMYASSASQPQDYQKTAHGYLESNDVGIVFFRRIHYNEYTKLTKSIKYFARTAFPANTYALLNNAVSIQIRIIKTNSSVPALAKVEVWGQPSRSCDKVLRNNIVKMWEERTLQEPETNAQAKNKEDTRVIDLKFDIPEEFLDSITYTIMALPFILPCGKIVDQSTLEKHEEQEAKWGRAPSDPFTGKMFTANNRPILATALKARIDKFLIEHSEEQELLTVPRTIGRKEKNDNSEICNSDSDNNILDVNLNRPIPCNSEDETGCQAPSYHVYQTQNKRARLDKDNASNCKHDLKPSFSTHEEEIDLSLDLALQSTLSRLPTYTRFSNSNSETAIPQCVTCKSNDMLFKLPCEHFLCRKCIVLKKETSDLKCDTCDNSFQSSDPVRYHI